MNTEINKHELCEELRQRMRKGEVKFTFVKKNGEMRDARGTLDMSEGGLIAPEFYPKGTGKEYQGIVKYFDLDKQAWRSFDEDQLVSIND